MQQADVILHVRDMAHPKPAINVMPLWIFLAIWGSLKTIPRLIEVQNKIDLLPEEDRKHLTDYAERLTDEVGQVPFVEGLRQEAHGGLVGVSALNGEGIPQLLDLLDKLLAQGAAFMRLMCLWATARLYRGCMRTAKSLSSAMPRRERI